MKKIAMFTMGTRGDIQPYIFLARGLVRNRYDEKKRNAEAISEKIRKEGGVAAAVRLIDRNLK